MPTRTSPDAFELYSTEYVTRMKVSDSTIFSEYKVVKDKWKPEWNKPVQVPSKRLAVTKSQNTLGYRELNVDPAMLRNECTKKYPFLSYEMSEEDEKWLSENVATRSMTRDNFEEIIADFERTYYRIRVHSLNSMNSSFKGHSRCSICAETSHESMIYRCRQCNAAVHKSCGRFPDNMKEWLCELCEHSIRSGGDSSTVSCVLCPNKGGVFCRIGTTWAHRLCLHWLKADVLADIPDANWKLSCHVCHQVYGACVKCVGCSNAFHVTCGFKKHFRMVSTNLQIHCDHGESKTSKNAFRRTLLFEEIYLMENRFLPDLVICQNVKNIEIFHYWINKRYQRLGLPLLLQYLDIHDNSCPNEFPCKNSRKRMGKLAKRKTLQELNERFTVSRALLRVKMADMSMRDKALYTYMILASIEYSLVELRGIFYSLLPDYKTLDDSESLFHTWVESLIAILHHDALVSVETLVLLSSMKDMRFAVCIRESLDATLISSLYQRLLDAESSSSPSPIAKTRRGRKRKVSGEDFAGVASTDGIGANLRENLLDLVEELKRCDRQGYFHLPVDLRTFSDYFYYVATPMDLSLIISNIKRNKYKTFRLMADDVHQIVRNCRLYNQQRPELLMVANDFEFRSFHVLEKFKQENERKFKEFFTTSGKALRVNQKERENVDTVMEENVPEYGYDRPIDGCESGYEDTLPLASVQTIYNTNYNFPSISDSSPSAKVIPSSSRRCGQENESTRKRRRLTDFLYNAFPMALLKR